MRVTFRIRKNESTRHAIVRITAHEVNRVSA